MEPSVSPDLGAPPPRADESDSRSGDVVLALRRPPLWSGRWLLFLGVIGIVATVDALDSIVRGTLDAGAPVEVLLQQVAMPMLVWSLFVLNLGRRLWARRGPTPRIELGAESFTLPRDIESRRVVRILYRDLRTVALGGVATRPRVLIESWDHIFVLSADEFELPEGPLRLLDELNQRVRGLADSEAIIAGMVERQNFAQRAATVRPWMTHIILGLLAVFYLNQYAAGDAGSAVSWLRWGALNRDLVVGGDWYRLVAANFLHGFLLHFVLNALGIYAIGPIVERLFGWARFLVIYLVSGLVATAASTFVTAPTVSVGASGALFGLLGALAAVNVRLGRQLPLGFRQPRRVWVSLVLVNGALFLLLMALPLGVRIDTIAHFAGLLSGVVLALVLLGGRKKIEVNERAPVAVQAIAITLAGLYAVGLAEAVRHAAAFEPETTALRYVEVILAGSQGMEANNQAFLIAIDPDAERPLLEKARVAAEAVVRDMPDEPTVRDTLATVLYRLERYDEAIEQQRRVVAKGADAVYMTQLLRFLMAARQAGRAVRDADLLALEGGEDGPRLSLTLRRDLRGGNESIWVVSRGGKVMGSLRLLLGSRVAEVLTVPVGGGAWPDDAELEVLSVESAPGSLKAGSVEATYFPAEPGVLAFP